MKIRYSIRSILAVIAVAAVYLGMIEWAQVRARGFAETLNQNTGRVAMKLLDDTGLTSKQDFCLGKELGNRAELLKPTLTETLMLSRKCLVEFTSSDGDKYYDNRVEYSVGLIQTRINRSWQTVSAAR